MLHSLYLVLETKLFMTCNGRRIARTGTNPACQICQMGSFLTVGEPWSAVQLTCEAILQLHPQQHPSSEQPAVRSVLHRGYVLTRVMIRAGVLHFHWVSGRRSECCILTCILLHNSSGIQAGFCALCANTRA